MSELRTLTDFISEHGGLIQTGPFGSQLHQHEYTDVGIPVVMPKDIIAGRVDESTVARIPEEKALALSRHALKAGDIIFPRRGEISKCALIDEQQAGFLCGTGCLKIALPKAALFPRFVYYYLGLSHVVEWLERNAVGTTMLNLNTGILGGVKIPVIPLPQQKRIADVLSAYDDLIENNRRRIKLLEEAARLLYREWFVHLRFPGHEHVKIVDGVPEGWERKVVPDLIAINPTERIERGREVWYVPMAALSETGMTVDRGDFERRTVHTAVKFRTNDVLLARITPCLENGKTGFVYFLDEGDVACGSTEFIILRGISVSPYFVYCLARTYDFREHAIKSMIGSSGRQRVQAGCFDEYGVFLPPSSLLSEFDDSVAPMFKQIAVLDQQTEKLRQARDLLLPRLMSGELSV